MDDAEFREEVREDFAKASRAMADAHRFFHASDGGWNKCEQEPCHSVCVLLGDVAVLLMSVISDEPGVPA